jgi:hypothetical protein
MKFSPKIPRHSSSSQSLASTIYDSLVDENICSSSSSSTAESSFLPCIPLSRLPAPEFFTGVFHYKVRSSR